MEIKREHLAGLKLANDLLQTIAGFEQDKLDDLIAQASAAPEQEAVAWAFKERVWRTSLGGSVWVDKIESHAPDHDLLEAKDVVPLYTHADPSEVDRLRRLVDAKECERLQHLEECAAEVNAIRQQLAEAQAQLEKHIPLYESLNRAAGELPEGWSICINVERDGGGVELFDQDGNEVDDFPSNHERMDRTANDAIDAAIAAAQPADGVKSDE